MQRLILLFFIGCQCSTSSYSLTGTIPLAELANQRGIVIFLRHAYAPGFGDPTNFEIDDCSTQRNLDKIGRHQSLELGQAFKKVGLNNLLVLSSLWCRCLDTARIMNIGPVQPFIGLNSFFEGHVSQSYTMNQLNEYLESIEETDRPVLMVTHQVVISAITGFSATSGEAILYEPKSRIVRQIEFP